MADAGNIVVSHHSTGHRVVLYTHWGGSELPELTRAALKRMAKPDWDDAPYVTRVIFSQLILGDSDGILASLGDPHADREAMEAGYRYIRKVMGELAGTDGYGISSGIENNDHLVVCVDCENLQVSYTDENLRTAHPTFPRWTFDDFISAPVTYLMQVFH